MMMSVEAFQRMQSFKWPAWRVLLAAALLAMATGVPVFMTGELQKDSTPAEKARWEFGFVLIGMSLALSLCSIVCYLFRQFMSKRRARL